MFSENITEDGNINILEEFKKEISKQIGGKDAPYFAFLKFPNGQLHVLENVCYYKENVELIIKEFIEIMKEVIKKRCQKS